MKCYFVLASLQKNHWTIFRRPPRALDGEQHLKAGPPVRPLAQQQGTRLQHRG